MDRLSDRVVVNGVVAFFVLVIFACAWASVNEARKQTECARIPCSNGVGAQLLNGECVCPVVAPGCPR